MEQQFIQQIAREIRRYASPVAVSVRIAQACLESDFGRSELATKANNYFGIKSSAPWTGETYAIRTREYVKGVVSWQEANFRKYQSMAHSCEDHARFFTSTAFRTQHYRKVLESTDPFEQAKQLSSTYATDPGYGTKLIAIMKRYALTQWDKLQIISRLDEALGGQNKDRSKDAIKRIVWHYTAVDREHNRFISDHERYWQNQLGWNRGGYHYYIDSQGLIYQNYIHERITWGVANQNHDTLHISVEANHKNNYSHAQIASRHALTVHLLKELNLPATQVFGHWEVHRNSLCPGYSRSELDAYRQELAGALADYTSTTAEDILIFGGQRYRLVPEL